MPPIELQEKHVSHALFQFIFPFSLKSDISRPMADYLKELDFRLFHLKDSETENAYYGEFRLNHREIDSCFLPLTANILFPIAQHDKGFQRYSKKVSVEGQLNTKRTAIPFKVHSIDIIACPFALAFLTIRVEVQNLSFSQSIEFADRMRRIKGDSHQFDIHLDGMTEQSLINVLVKRFCPHLFTFINNEEVLFLERENMFVQSLLSLKGGELINPVDLYRFSTFCGYDPAGNPYVNANNLEFITHCLHGCTYERFGPTTNYYVQQNCFVGLTTTDITADSNSQSQRFYGFYYYSLLLTLFHKSVLLKIANSYSAIHIEKDKQEIEHLLYQVNSFMSNYFYTVYPLTSEGQEIFKLIRKELNIDHLYTNTKEILFSLVKYEDNNVAKKDSMLLLVLTLYTVICGIFSMNLFTHDLQGNIKWGHFKSYNPFEYFAVFIVFSGIIVVFTLAVQGLIQQYQNRKSQKKWVKNTIWSSKRN